MGIYLHLIDVRSPRGFTVVVPRGQRGNYRRLDPLITASDTMQMIVGRITSAYRRNARGVGPLDVIRIEAHGVFGPGSAMVNAIQLGVGLTAANATAFRPIANLWSRALEADEFGTNYERVIPRIEMHCCRLIPGCINTLRALATNSGAAVFASSSDQDVDARAGQNAFALEGPITRFNP